MEHLIRFAKKFSHVYLWLNQHGSKLNWMLDWLLFYQSCPSRDNNIQMHKPKYEPNPYAQQRDTFAYSHTGQPTTRKKVLLDFIKEGKQLDNPDTDSDRDVGDSKFEVNQKIDCKDSVNKWLPAQVVSVSDGRILVHYEGWTTKWDEWLDTNSSRIADYGRHSKEGQTGTQTVQQVRIHPQIPTANQTLPQSMQQTPNQRQLSNSGSQAQQTSNNSASSNVAQQGQSPAPNSRQLQPAGTAANTGNPTQQPSGPLTAVVNQSNNNSSNTTNNASSGTTQPSAPPGGL
jgi:hypothetical protein